MQKRLQRKKQKNGKHCIVLQFETDIIQEYWDYQRMVYEKDILIQKYIEAKREAYMKEQSGNIDWSTYFEKWKEELRQEQNFKKIDKT